MIAALTACGSPQSEETPPVNPIRVTADAQPTTTVEDSVPTRNSAATPFPNPIASGEDDADACGASKVASWIGREATVAVRRAVTDAAAPEADRWLYPDSVVTQDYRPDRLNVTMEKGTDIIMKVECG